MRPPPHWTKDSSWRYMSCCAANCRTPLWSASVITLRLNATTDATLNCSAGAPGGWGRSPSGDDPHGTVARRPVQNAQALGGGHSPKAVVGEALVPPDAGASGREAQCRDQLVVVFEITGD